MKYLPRPKVRRESTLKLHVWRAIIKFVVRICAYLMTVNHNRLVNAFVNLRNIKNSELNLYNITIAQLVMPLYHIERGSLDFLASSSVKSNNQAADHRV